MSKQFLLVIVLHTVFSGYIALLTYVLVPMILIPRLETGAIVPDMSADFVAVDLHHPSLAGWNTEDFLDVLFFGASSEIITQT